MSLPFIGTTLREKKYALNQEREKWSASVLIRADDNVSTGVCTHKFSVHCELSTVVVGLEDRRL